MKGWCYLLSTEAALFEQSKLKWLIQWLLGAF